MISREFLARSRVSKYLSWGRWKSDVVLRAMTKTMELDGPRNETSFDRPKILSLSCENYTECRLLSELYTRATSIHVMLGPNFAI
jgi:hypothetical protein